MRIRQLILVLSSMMLLMLLEGCSFCEKKIYVPVKVYYSEPSPFDSYTCTSPALPEGNVTSQAELMGYFSDNYLVGKKYHYDCNAAKKMSKSRKKRIEKLNRDSEKKLKRITND